MHPAAVPSVGDGCVCHVNTSSILQAVLGNTGGGGTGDQSPQSQAPTSHPSKLFIEGRSVLAGSSQGSRLPPGHGPGPDAGVQYICCWTNIVCV